MNHERSDHCILHKTKRKNAKWDSRTPELSQPHLFVKMLYLTSDLQVNNKKPNVPEGLRDFADAGIFLSVGGSGPALVATGKNNPGSDTDLGPWGVSTISPSSTSSSPSSLSSFAIPCRSLTVGFAGIQVLASVLGFKVVLLCGRDTIAATVSKTLGSFLGGKQDMGGSIPSDLLASFLGTVSFLLETWGCEIIGGLSKRSLVLLSAEHPLTGGGRGGAGGGIIASGLSSTGAPASEGFPRVMRITSSAESDSSPSSSDASPSSIVPSEESSIISDAIKLLISGWGCFGVSVICASQKSHPVITLRLLITGHISFCCAVGALNTHSASDCSLQSDLFLHMDINIFPQSDVNNKD